jgi:steroid 5-alpha reductase family enzyme
MDPLEELIDTQADASVVWAIYGGGFAISVVFQFLCFLVAYKLQTEHFYDLMGGVNSLILVAWSVLYKSGSKSFSSASSTRLWTVSCLFSLSRFWLLSFLWWRAGARGGDSRFETVKPFFFRFLAAWMVQAIWVFAIAMPMLFVNGFPRPAALSSGLDYFCAFCFPLALFMQISSDVQKAIWVAKGREGGFCTSGLWRYSRHPNYFGEILMWWCGWGFTVALWKDSDNGTIIAQGVLGVLSPLITTIILMFVSGLPLAEGQNLARYMKHANYSEYRDGTSILVPIPGYRYLPGFVKRTLLCEWTMYQYKPPAAADEGSGYVSPEVSNPAEEEGIDPERTSALEV